MKTIFVLSFIFLINFCFAQSRPYQFDFYPPIEKKKFVQHKYYALSYSEKHEQAEWVAYQMTIKDLQGTAQRINDYRPDPLIRTISAQLDDYRGSGYDRGHLVPAGDMKRSKEAMSESFFLSNMSPQKSEFNGGAWRSLEEIVRNWVHQKGHLYILTGPILNKNLKKIPSTKVSIPDFYYKVLLYTESEFNKNWQAIAVVMPQESNGHPLSEQIMSIDSLERRINIDFFHNLPDSIESKIESSINLKFWSLDKFSSKNTKLFSNKRSAKETLPLSLKELPNGTINTHQTFCIDEGEEITVCGCMVSATHSVRTGYTYLNLDRKYPAQIFTIRIKEENRKNFPYKPEEYFYNKRMCVKGIKELLRGYPSIMVDDDDDLFLIAE